MSPDSLGHRVLVGTGWLTGWRMVSRLLGFLSLLVLTQILSPGDFGLVALASSVSAATDALSQIGVKDALVRLRGESTEHYNTAFTFQAGRGLLTGTVIALMAMQSDAWFGDPRLEPLLLILAALAVVAGWENIGVVRLARELDFRTQVVLQAAPRLLGFVVTVVLALLLRTYWALVAGAAVTRLLGVALTYATAPHRPRPSLHGWRYLLHFSFWNWAASIAVVIWARSDPFVIGPVMGTALLGLYTVSCEIAILPITELIEPVAAALFPGFAMAHRTGSLSKGLALNVAGALALGAIPFSVGISATSGYVVAALLGPGWTAAQPIVAVTAFLCVFSPFSYVCSSVLSAQGHVRRAFYCNAIAAVTRIATVMVLRYTHDLLVIAATNVVFVGLESALFVGQVRAVGNHGLRDLVKTMARAVGAGCITAAVLAALPGTWAVTDLERFPALALGGVIGACAFPVFFAAQALLWIAMGRPEGAEATAWRMVAPVVGRVWGKVRLG